MSYSLQCDTVAGVNSPSNAEAQRDDLRGGGRREHVVVAGLGEKLGVRSERDSTADVIATFHRVDIPGNDCRRRTTDAGIPKSLARGRWNWEIGRAHV